MNYDGNQLFGVDDRIKTDYGYNFFDNGHTCNSITREYDYDANGNITCDRNKEIIGISYNHLNLPKVVEFRNNNKLDYLYDANGTKLRQDVIVANTLSKRTDFISNFVFINNAPSWINFDEGRVIMDGTTVFFTETRRTSSPRPSPLVPELLSKASRRELDPTNNVHLFFRLKNIALKPTISPQQHPLLEERAG